MPLSRGVPVQLDRERRLRYPMAAIAAIEDKYEIDVLAGGGLPTATLEDIIWFIWLGLTHAGETLEPDTWWDRVLFLLGLAEERELQPSDVAEWIDMQNLPHVTEALDAAMGGAEIEADGRPGKPQPQTTSPSGSSGPPV